MNAKITSTMTDCTPTWSVKLIQVQFLQSFTGNDTSAFDYNKKAHTFHVHGVVVEKHSQHEWMNEKRAEKLWLAYEYSYKSVFYLNFITITIYEFYNHCSE